jgi:adenylate cyclase
MGTKKPDLVLLFLPIAVGALFAALNLLGAVAPLELRLYDQFLKLKPAVAERPSIVLLDVDDFSIESVGSWPWPRGLMAKGMEELTEFGASYAVFDIEYVEKSPMSVDREYLQGGLKSEFNGLVDDVGSNIGELFGALQGGNIKLSDAREYGNQLIELLKDDNSQLYTKTERVAVENDSYLGRAMRLFGSANITINLQDKPVEKANPKLRSIAESRFAYPKVEVLAPIGTQAKGFLLPILEISSMAATAGFTNVKVDPDGIRRRIRLVEEIGGKQYLQLAFSPLVHWLGNPEIVIYRSRILLKEALVDGKRTDISIPLDEEGHMLINWPKKTYAESFKHVSFFELLQYRQNEDHLIENLRNLRSIEVWRLVPGANPLDRPLNAWKEEDRTRLAALDSGSAEDRAAWLAAKASAKSETADFLAAGWDAKIAAVIDKARSSAPKSDTTLYDSLKSRFSTMLGNSIAAEGIIDSDAKTLRARLAGAFCIMGWTATATTDMGANPFNESYVNVGTHAAVANTILQRAFITPAPTWVGSLAALVLSILVVLVIARLGMTLRIVVGILITLGVLAGSYAIFGFTGTYIPTLAPALATFLSFLGYTLVSFLISEREKSFLRRAFGTYLSGDIINQIIADPDKLSLGGQKMWITAQFTDVRGFSTISEALDAEQLVKLLNLYLTGMSDIILERRGTIDKFEGDAIISFFGAPIHFDGHAKESVLSAILMKKKEAEMNIRFLEEKLTPTPLLTRIGLNTGDIVVGNMGTEKKMNYTIMGNAVNLAARLEGVNKQYGTWILASDDTKKEAGDDFVARRLDRVRVVGISTPVQLWEMVDTRTETNDETLDFLARFDAAHEVFDSHDWKKASELFTALIAERPADGPSKTYNTRSENFLKKAPEANWDGVFSLSEK